MKIIIINNLYQPFARGGAERIIEQLVQGFLILGHKTIIISTRPLVSDKVSLNFTFRSLYYDLHKFPLILRLFWHIFNFFPLVRYFKLKKILKKEKPDLIITNNLIGVGFFVPKLIKELKIKHIHILHDIQLLHPSGLIIYGKEDIIKTIPAKIYQQMTKNIFASPDLIVSPSQWLLDVHMKAGFFSTSKKIKLFNPFLDLTKELIAKDKEQKKIFKFLYVGQLEEHKGIIFLIENFSNILNQLQLNASLDIVGSGTLLPRIKKLAAEDMRINHLANIKFGQANKLMSEYSALIVPSLCYENSPTVIYEAYQANILVIASSIGGIGELTQLTGGLLFEPGNIIDLTDKIKYFTTNNIKLNNLKKNIFLDPVSYINILLKEVGLK
jgi:glycosyltransferase involved in cell wall biosynthesis